MYTYIYVYTHTHIYIYTYEWPEITWSPTKLFAQDMTKHSSMLESFEAIRCTWKCTKHVQHVWCLLQMGDQKWWRSILSDVLHNEAHSNMSNQKTINMIILCVLFLSHDIPIMCMCNSVYIHVYIFTCTDTLKLGSSTPSILDKATCELQAKSEVAAKVFQLSTCRLWLRSLVESPGFPLDLSYRHLPSLTSFVQSYNTKVS